LALYIVIRDVVAAGIIIIAVREPASYQHKFPSVNTTQNNHKSNTVTNNIEIPNRIHSHV